MEIKSVKNEMELDNVLDFVKKTFLKINISWSESFKNHDFYVEKINSNLLLYMVDNGIIIASIFSYEDNKNITIGHICVDENYRKKGIGKIIMDDLEKRIKKLGYKLITLGSLEVAEGFYENIGFKGSLLIQSEINTIDELLLLRNDYEIAWTNIYNNKIYQVCLSLEKPDRELQKKYKEVYPNCNTQMIFQKILE
jgi:ribosomal protein S18 acetylase RimI-like enzyme